MCPKSYEYHYVKKIRPQVTSGALLFGSALDSALNILLLEKNLEKAEVEFEKQFTMGKINNKEYYLPTCEKVVYSKTDFDFDLLTDEDIKQIESTYKKIHGEDFGHPLDLYQRLSPSVKSLSADDLRIYNLFNWLSMRNKGKLMLRAYLKKVIPSVKKVISVQEQIELSNELDEKVTGYLDLVAEFGDHGLVILDNKTSTREYAADSVVTSSQLALYLHATSDKYKTRKAGYIVLKKIVNKNRTKICSVCSYDGSGSKHKTCNNIVNEKRCGGAWKETIKPDIDIQILIDEIPEQTEQIVIENVDTVNEAIKAQIFPRNLNNCTNYWGGLCPYFGLCYKNKMEGLENV
jgi:hypothetical protein